MEIEELKRTLLGRTYPEKVKISEDQTVVDVPLFLKVQFIEVEKWQKDLHKCPAYVRLLKFKKAIEELENQ
ncbi:DUF6965 family protein [Sphingobacterium thermophilum]|uniref:DUF6965 domain-containing protein n=1 Tax=Sphingobacterium thermophilum TaxID=768534 RepID=A0ABP8QYE5_9SPHI